MNTIKKVTAFPAKNPIEMGQIYQFRDDFYVVAKKDNNPEGCLINLQTGNLWSDESPEETITNNSDFVLFIGTIQITTDY